KFEAELRKAAEATAAVVTRETDVRRDLESRLAAAEQRAGEFRRQVEEMESDLNAERIRSVEDKNALDAEWNEKLQRIVTNLASDHESDLGEAMTHREQARAEVRQATKRLEQAQRINAELAAKHGALEHDVAALRIALDEERSRGAIERGELEEKLHALVGNLASDHENDVGELMEQREMARAQARTFEARLAETQRAFDDATQALATMNHDLRQARTAAEDERKLRERLDIEWNEKLQKIVTHLAMDHEADVGQATVEKEGAKAEARSLTMRLASVQQTIDSEREAFRAAQQKWTSIRDSLLDKMQKTEDRYRQLIEKQRREHQTEREAIEAELRSLKTSERPFTQEEIAAIRSEEFGPSEPFPAIEAFQAAEPLPEPIDPVEPVEHFEPVEHVEPVEPANATEPMPAFVEERKPLILVVHHNPALRSMTKDALSANGYEVLTAADGAEGLRMTRSHKPDVVIADVSMPKMDGRELCQAIKGSEETAATKIVLMSGMYTNEIPMGTSTTDFPPDDILRKPVKAEALKASVAGLLAKTVAAS
ncbi:MAG: response regulator, partial [Thermoanaerobaculia bacterium]